MVVACSGRVRPRSKQPPAPAHKPPEGAVPEDQAALADARLSLTESDAVRAWLRGELPSRVWTKKNRPSEPRRVPLSQADGGATQGCVRRARGAAIARRPSSSVHPEA